MNAPGLAQRSLHMRCMRVVRGFVLFALLSAMLAALAQLAGPTEGSGIAVHVYLLATGVTSVV